MQKRRLGQSQIFTAPLVLGGNVFGWTLDEPSSFRILDEFVGAALEFIDTADVYSNFIPRNVGGESAAWRRISKTAGRGAVSSADT